MATRVLYTEIPDDGMTIAEIDEFIEVLKDLQLAAREQLKETPDDNIRIQIYQESVLAKVNKHELE
jgi:hypothetical protein